MNTRNIFHLAIIYFIAAVWLINGLICKLLNLVPRHEQIVARISGSEHAAILTRTIGIAEIAMAVWIVSRFKPRLCAVIQIIVVAIMNTIEFFKAPDLLLFGKINACIAFAFIVLIFYTEFIPEKNKAAA